MSTSRFVLPLLTSLGLLACGGEPGSASPLDAASDAGANADASDAQSSIDAAHDATGDAAPIAIGSRSDQGLRVEMLADAPLHVGLNSVHFRLTDEATSAVYAHADIRQHPLMDMGQMQHACPFTDPATDANAASLFDGEIVFSMASGTGTWSETLDIDLSPAGGTHHVVFADLDVADTDARRMVTTSATTYLVTLSFAQPPAVGVSPFVLTVHRKASMTSFPPDPEVSVTLFTGSSDASLGSPAALAYTQDGKYDGSVSFDAAGHWVLAFDLSKAGATLGTATYSLDL